MKRDEDTRPITTVTQVPITMPTPVYGLGALRLGEWRCGCGKIKAGSCRSCPVCKATRPKGVS